MQAPVTALQLRVRSASRRLPNRLPRPGPERIGCDTIDADDDAGMLNASIPIQQLRTDGPHVGALRMLEHRRQPVGLNHLDVVVQEEQLLAARMPDAKVVQRRVVERLAPLVHLASRRKRGEILHGVGVRALVVDDDDLVAIVIGAGPDALERGLEQCSLVARGDDDRHERPLPSSRIASRNHALPFARTRHCARPELPRRRSASTSARALVAIGGMACQNGIGRRRTTSAVIQHLGHVRDSLGALGQSKHEVVDLALPGGISKPTNLDHQLPAEDAKALEIVRGEQQIGTPVRLEQWILAPARLRNPIFVRVDDVRVGLD